MDKELEDRLNKIDERLEMIDDKIEELFAILCTDEEEDSEQEEN